MIKIRLEIQNEAQDQMVEVVDNRNKVDPTVDDFLNMFEGALVSLGFAKYTFEVKNDETV